MSEFTYLIDRGGSVHVWDRIPVSHTNLWQRAVCGDPGDFNTLLDYKGDVTCDECRERLGMGVQLSFSDSEGGC